MDTVFREKEFVEPLYDFYDKQYQLKNEKQKVM